METERTEKNSFSIVLVIGAVLAALSLFSEIARDIINMLRGMYQFSTFLGSVTSYAFTVGYFLFIIYCLKKNTKTKGIAFFIMAMSILLYVGACCADNVFLLKELGKDSSYSGYIHEINAIIIR